MNTNLNTRNNAHSVFIDEGKLLDDEGKKIGNYAKHIWCVLIITKFNMNYLCLCLPLFGIFASNALNRSSLRFCGLETKSTQK